MHAGSVVLAAAGRLSASRSPETRRARTTDATRFADAGAAVQAVALASVFGASWAGEGGGTVAAEIILLHEIDGTSAAVSAVIIAQLFRAAISRPTWLTRTDGGAAADVTLPAMETDALADGNLAAVTSEVGRAGALG